MRDAQSDHYVFDELSWAEQMLEIEPGSLSEKKLQRIGVDVSERREQARRILKESGHEQPIQGR